MPRIREAIPFTNLRDLRLWIIYSCVDERDRYALSQHFSISDRQGSLCWDGIDSWLDTLKKEQDKYFDVIYKTQKSIAGQLSQAIVESQKQRAYLDADRLIKSNNEVREDMLVRYFSVLNTLLPNPITPIVSLALDLDLSLNADTKEEQRLAIAALSNDIINIALVALTEVGARKLSAATHIPPQIEAAMVTEDMGQMMRQAMDTTQKIFGSSLPGAYLEQYGFKGQDFFLLETNQQQVRVHPEIMAKIKKLSVPDVILENPETLLYDEHGIILGRDGNRYLQVDNKFYEIDDSTINKSFRLKGNEQIVIFLDDELETSTFFLSEKDNTKFDDFVYSCRRKRAASSANLACPGFDEQLANRLATLDSGIDSTLAEVLEPLPTRPYLFRIRADDRLFVKFNDSVFQAKVNPRNDHITLFKRCAHSSLQCINGGMAKGPTIFFSEKNNKFYPNNKIGRLQDLSGFSYPLAKLQIFCQKNPAALLTREEISTLHRYASLDYDAINEFMRAGMPENYLNQFFRQHLHHSINILERVLQKIPSYNGLVYRGALLPAEDVQRINSGDLLHAVSFISTSVDPDVARIFAVETTMSKIGILYEIKITTAGHPIALYTSRIREAEVLIESNSWFHVEKKEGNTVFLAEIQSKSIDEFRLNNPGAMTYTL